MLTVEGGALFDVPDSEYETCVSCWCVTNVKKTTPIEERYFFTPAGPLCCECGKENEATARTRKK